MAGVQLGLNTSLATELVNPLADYPRHVPNDASNVTSSIEGHVTVLPSNLRASILDEADDAIWIMTSDAVRVRAPREWLRHD